MDKFSKILFIFSILFFTFLFGFISKKYSIFPSAYVEGSISKIRYYFKDQTVDRIKKIFFKFSDQKDSEGFGRLKQNKILQFSNVFDNSFSKPEFLNDYYILSKAFGDDIKIVNQEGEIKYAWNFEKFPKNTFLLPFFLDSQGNLLFGDDENIYFINNKSEIIFQKKIYNHHWGDESSDYIYFPGRQFQDLPLKDTLYSNSVLSKCNYENSLNETIVRVKKDGSDLKEFELLPLILNTDLKKHLFHCHDPLHLNDVRVLTKEDADQFIFDDIEENDLLISMKQINTIMIVDSEFSEIKWEVNNLFHRHHAPRITNRGTVLVFDNEGGNPYYGSSRIIEIDVNSKKTVGIYDGNDDHKLYSLSGGRIQIIDDKIIINSSTQGELFEIDCPEKQKYISNDCKPIFLYTTKVGNDSIYGETNDKGNKTLELHVADLYKKDYLTFINNE